MVDGCVRMVVAMVLTLAFSGLGCASLSGIDSRERDVVAAVPVAQCAGDEGKEREPRVRLVTRERPIDVSHSTSVYETRSCGAVSYVAVRCSGAADAPDCERVPLRHEHIPRAMPD